MAQSVSLSIPDKLYFKIGEVSEIVGVKPYVLRYWETEFTDITPVKSRTNQRLYKRRDVELLLNIKDLLYHQNFTINGARKRLKEIQRESRQKIKEGQHQLGLELDRGVVSATSGLNKDLQGSLNLLNDLLKDMGAHAQLKLNS